MAKRHIQDEGDVGNIDLTSLFISFRRSSVLIQKFESLQIRVAVADLFWAAKGISDGSEDGGTGSQRG